MAAADHSFHGLPMALSDGFSWALSAPAVSEPLDALPLDRLDRGSGEELVTHELVLDPGCLDASPSELSAARDSAVSLVNQLCVFLLEARAADLTRSL